MTVTIPVVKPGTLNNRYFHPAAWVLALPWKVANKKGEREREREIMLFIGKPKGRSMMISKKGGTLTVAQGKGSRCSLLDILVCLWFEWLYFHVSFLFFSLSVSLSLCLLFWCFWSLFPVPCSCRSLSNSQGRELVFRSPFEGAVVHLFSSSVFICQVLSFSLLDEVKLACIVNTTQFLGRWFDSSKTPKPENSNLYGFERNEDFFYYRS